MINMSKHDIYLNFHNELREAVFVERPNRFLVRSRLLPTGGYSGRSGAVKSPKEPLVEAHLPDPGRLQELLVPGRSIWIAPAHNPGRKTNWSVVLCETPDGGGLVSLNSTLPNRLVEKGLAVGGIDEFRAWLLLRREYRRGHSRWDFLLAHREENSGRRMALEIKSVTLVDDDGIALFPDAVTKRGARHLHELAALAQTDGWAAAVLFIVQREDALAFRPAAALDPTFAAALKEARLAGVKVYCRKCRITPRKITLTEQLPIMPS